LLKKLIFGFHRDDDLPATIGYYRNGNVECVEYRKNGVIHRDGDKPSIIYYDENNNGSVTSEAYFKGYMLHRENDLPACIDYYSLNNNDGESENRNVKREKYRMNSKCYREGDGPTEIEYSEDGNKITEIWMSEDGRTELKRNIIDLDLEFTKSCNN